MRARGGVCRPADEDHPDQLPPGPRTRRAGGWNKAYFQVQSRPTFAGNALSLLARYSSLRYRAWESLPGVDWKFTGQWSKLPV